MGMPMGERVTALETNYEHVAASMDRIEKLVAELHSHILKREGAEIGQQRTFSRGHSIVLAVTSVVGAVASVGGALVGLFYRAQLLPTIPRM